MSRISVIKPGLLTSVQDAGRPGYEHVGVMVGGWLDDFAARWANRLVGNAGEAAVLEVTILGPTLEALEPGWLALAGANLGAAINGKPWAPGSSRRVQSGDRVSFGRANDGARAYLAFAGGLHVEPVWGSRSTDLVAGFGGIAGRAVQAGDVLSYAGDPGKAVRAPVETCLVGPVLHVLPGVGLHRFPPGTWERLIGGHFRVGHQSNRVGMRLTGDTILEAPPAGDHVSEGMAIGSVEVPPSGELLVLMKSRGSIGGYPTVAHVIIADWPRLAQLTPGSAVQFAEISSEDARKRLRDQEDLLHREVLR